MYLICTSSQRFCQCSHENQESVTLEFPGPSGLCTERREPLPSVQPQHPSPAVSKPVSPQCQQGRTGGDSRMPHRSVSLYSSPEFISPGCHSFQLYLQPGEVHSGKKSQPMHTLRSLSHPKWPMAGSATG